MADDDGVVCVPRAMADKTLKFAQEREANEVSKRERLATGELGQVIDFTCCRGTQRMNLNGSWAMFRPWGRVGYDFTKQVGKCQLHDGCVLRTWWGQGVLCAGGMWENRGP